MNAARITAYSPPALLAAGTGLALLLLLSAGLTLAAAYADLREDQARLADLRQRAALAHELKTAIAGIKQKDPRAAGFFLASDGLEMNRLFQQKVTNAVASESGQILAINAFEPGNKKGIVALRLEANLSLPRHRLEALIAVLEEGDAPVFFDDMRLDAREAEANGTVRIQTSLRAFGIAPEAQ